MNEQQLKANEEIKKFAADPSDLVIVGLSVRPGVKLFTVKLEHELFPPRSVKNQVFNLMLFRWNGMAWAIVRVPMGSFEEVNRIANECGLHISNGVPVMLGGAAEDCNAELLGTPCSEFPANGRNVFSLEGQFQGNEDEEIQKIFNKDIIEMKKYYEDNVYFNESKLDEIDKWLEESMNSFRISPIQHFLMSGYLRKMTTHCFGAFLPLEEGDKPVCIIGFQKIKNAEWNSILTCVYTHRVCRKWGLGKNTFVRAIKWADENNMTPIKAEVYSDVLGHMIDTLPPDLRKKMDLVVKSHEKDLTVEEERFYAENGR